MAPSRGLTSLLRPTRYASIPGIRWQDFAKTVVDPINKSQVYISKTHDPYLNLSIEHYLLQKSPADSNILFLYRNRPSIIIGRNQNPWVEVNLAHLRKNDLTVELVRRRSGGGTVFHDLGNVNYSVICPTANFNRDKHAEMVVRAIKNLRITDVRVNVRHDIVVDKMVNLEPEAPKVHEVETFKVSGSAYKLTRLRSLHHGTCLLSSPYLDIIPEYLHSPAKPLMKAKGVDSVSSKITNLGIDDVSEFETRVADEFTTLYGDGVAGNLSTDMINVPEIAEGCKELRSEAWIFCQTPQFTFSINRETMSKAGIDVPASFPWDVSLEFSARNGIITEVSIKTGETDAPWGPISSKRLVGRKVHEITDWELILVKNLPQQSRTMPTRILGRRLNDMFGGGSIDLSQGRVASERVLSILDKEKRE